MARTRRSLIRRVAVIGGVGLTGALTGCSGQQGGSAPTETETDEPVASSPSMSPSPTATPSTPVGVSTHDIYDDILVDSAGRTLYMFAQDSDGESICYDDCAEAWPPLTVGDDRTIDSGPAVSAELGTIQREDGSRQVTANELPLYYFVNDSEPGAANGMGVINAWFVLRPDGSVLKPTVSMTEHEQLGPILTDAAERTLYMFEPDSEGQSTCTGDCAEAWPPLTVDSQDELFPAATISASLGTIERDDGSLQVTANDHPLYYFVNDSGPGEAAGQGINAVWFVLRPDGSVHRSQTPTPSPTSTPTPTPSPTPTPTVTPTNTPMDSGENDDGGGGSY